MPASYVYSTPERFIQAWRLFGVEHEGVRKAGEAVIAAYAQPSRFYHDRRHLDDVMWHLDWAKQSMMTTQELAEMDYEQRGRLFGEVELALWYHDAVYDAKAKDNEQQSRDWFLKDAEAFNLPEEVRENVAHLIDLTAHHKQAATLQESLMSDCDLAIFAAAPEKFRAYDADIRREYAHVPAPAYRLARRKVLEGFLNQPRIFKTAAFNRFQEQKARKNLTDALSQGFFQKLLSVFRK